MNAGDFFSAVVDGIEEGDHRLIVVDVGTRIPPEISAQMEADGYVFGYSPPPENGKRKLYFVREREPASRM